MSEHEQTLPQVDWRRWITRWDAMQTAYLPYREERFTVMLDVVEQVIGESFVALDLACGPGAISQRLLARFPQARCVAVDYDPALLALGHGALGDVDGRVRWVEADLREPNWIEQLGEKRIEPVQRCALDDSVALARCWPAHTALCPTRYARPVRWSRAQWRSHGVPTASAHLSRFS